MFGACQRAAAEFAGDQPSLAVARVAIGIPGGVAQDGGGAGDLIPAQQPVVGDVGEQQIASVAVIGWSLGETKSGGDALDRGVPQDHMLKARVEHDDVGVGIADGAGGLPPRRAALFRCRDACGAGEHGHALAHGRLLPGRAVSRGFGRSGHGWRAHGNPALGNGVGRRAAKPWMRRMAGIFAADHAVNKRCPGGGGPACSL